MPAETAVDIKAEWLANELPLPGCCVKHGLPAARNVTFAVRSDPRIGSRKKVLVPGYTSVNRAAEYLTQVKIVKVARWPLCARCVRQRTAGLTATGALLVAGLVALIAAGVAGGHGDAPAWLLTVLFLGGLAAMLLSVIPFQQASLGRLARAQVTHDGAAVHVTNPSPAFTAGLPGKARL